MKKRTIAYPEAHGLFAGQKPPEAALAADTTDVLAAGLARPKAERRRPKADLERVDALGA